MNEDTPWRDGTGDSSSYPRPRIEHTTEEVSVSERGYFVEAMEAEDQVFWSPLDGKNHTALKCMFMRHDGAQITIILPTEMVVGFMERCTHHFGFIFPYRYYDAPTVNQDDINQLLDNEEDKND